MSQKWIKCKDCNGTGKKFVLKLKGGGKADQASKKCPSCNGKGGYYSEGMQK